MHATPATVILERIRARKAHSIVPKSAEALATCTGGRVLSFLKQSSLERAIAQIGEELHSQYLITFKPGGEGCHRIAVSVKGRPELTAMGCRRRSKPEPA